jgi:chromosome segregation ATPase
MDIHEFHKALGESLDAMDRAAGAEDRVKAAERQLAQKQTEINALTDAHAKLKKQSDDHLAANLARLNEETEQHNAAVAELKRQHFVLEQRNKEQLENASSTLTNINASVGTARQERDDLLIEVSKLRGQVQDIAARIG